jgi:hypothetical protein
MKKLLIGFVLLSAFASISCNEIVIHAQSLPVTKTLAWNPNAVGDAVINYNVSLDGTSIGNPTSTSQAFTITAVGPHTLSVSATNQWGTGPSTLLNFTVVLPGAPSGLGIK